MDERIARQHIFPALGKYQLTDIPCNDVLLWHADCCTKFAPSTVNRIVALLKAVFNYAERLEFLDKHHNPTKHIVALKVPYQRERYLSQKEARRLLQVLNEYPNYLPALAIKLLLYTGARKSEILQARWEYLSIGQHILTVPLSKSGRARYIALSDAALSVIRSLPRRKGCPFLFPSRDGTKPFCDLFIPWKKFRTQAGIPDVRLHDLRHSFASFLVNAGESLYTVQALLGHSNPKITMRYAHLAQHSLIKAANTVGKIVR